MNIFEASNNYIVHETDADLTLRPVPIPVHLVQGDTTMPVLMVHLYDGGAQYSIPSSFSANLRLRKPDGTIVENIGAAGQNDDGTAVYFVITSAMASAAGLCVGVVELTRSGNIAASSRILIQVDRNPIQDGDEDSVSEINLIMAFENAGSFYVSDSQPSANEPYLWFDTSEGYEENMATYNERGRFKYIDSSGNTYNLYHPLERAPALQGGDLNDAPANSLYILTTDYTYTNLPDDSYAGSASWLFTYGTTASGGARLQILYVPYNSNKMYMRRRGSAWNSWIDITAMTEVTAAPTTGTDSGTALSGQTFARYGMQYGTVVNGSRYMTVQEAGYTSLNDLKGNTIFVCNRGYDIENMPEENNGWVITIGHYDNLAKFQFYATLDNVLYCRSYDAFSGWSWKSWAKLGSADPVTIPATPAKMYSIGNSILTGSVWVNDKYDHLVSYAYSPYGCIADAVGVSEDNETHTLLSSTGVLYDAGEGNFRDVILAADLTDYDILVTHLWYSDLGSSYAFGDIDSTDSSTLCGAVRAIVDHCREQNPAMHVVIISPQVVSATDRSSSAPFDYQFGDGYTRREADEMLHEMADKYRFIYVDWQDYDPAYHWADFVDTSNVHACKDRYYLGMGGYLGGKISAEVHF